MKHDQGYQSLQHESEEHLNFFYGLCFIISLYGVIGAILVVLP